MMIRIEPKLSAEVAAVCRSRCRLQKMMMKSRMRLSFLHIHSALFLGLRFCSAPFYASVPLRSLRWIRTTVLPIENRPSDHRALTYKPVFILKWCWHDFGLTCLQGAYHQNFFGPILIDLICLECAQFEN
jgi:hypothetical protein